MTRIARLSTICTHLSAELHNPVENEIPEYARRQAADLVCQRCGVIGEIDLSIASHDPNVVRATCAACGAWLKWVPTKPPEQRQAARQRGIEAWMATQPPTEKQLRLLKALGHKGTPANRLEASQLIDALLTSRGGA